MLLDGNSFMLDGKRCGLLSIEHGDNGDPDNFGFTQAQIESDIWLHNRLAEIFGWPRRKITAPDLKNAIREVFHLPESGFAVPQGQAHNGNLGANLLGLLQHQNTVVDAVQGAIAAVRADVKLQGDDEAKIVAKLNEVESMLPQR
jgi:hypothetical protein